MYLLPGVGIALSLLSVLVFAAWYLVVAVRLGRLATAARGADSDVALPPAVLPTRA